LITGKVANTEKIKYLKNSKMKNSIFEDGDNEKRYEKLTFSGKIINPK
jgi:hypothetical protein